MQTHPAFLRSSSTIPRCVLLKKDSFKLIVLLIFLIQLTTLREAVLLRILGQYVATESGFPRCFFYLSSLFLFSNSDRYYETPRPVVFCLYPSQYG